MTSFWRTIRHQLLFVLAPKTFLCLSILYSSFLHFFSPLSPPHLFWKSADFFNLWRKNCFNIRVIFNMNKQAQQWIVSMKSVALLWYTRGQESVLPLSKHWCQIQGYYNVHNMNCLILAVKSWDSSESITNLWSILPQDPFKTVYNWALRLVRKCDHSTYHWSFFSLTGLVFKHANIQMKEKDVTWMLDRRTRLDLFSFIQLILALNSMAIIVHWLFVWMQPGAVFFTLLSVGVAACLSKGTESITTVKFIRVLFFIWHSHWIPILVLYASCGYWM